MITQINSIDDVKAFFLLLIDEGLNFHPDEDFIDYINSDTKMPTYSPADAQLRNKLLDRAFEICERVNIDIYELCIELFQQ